MKKIYSVTLSIFLSTQLFAQKNYTEPQFILPGHTNDVNAIAISDNILASGSWDKNINLYNTDSPFALVRTLTGHVAPINALCFNKTGKLLASGSSDNMVKIWDSLYRVRNLEGHKGNVNCLLFDNTSRYLFSGSDDKTIIAWDIAAAKVFRTINNGQPVNTLAMQSNDPRFLFVGGLEPKIKVYNLANLQVARTFDGHTDAINSIAISSNNLYLLSGSNDKSARIWDLKTGKELRKLAVDCWKVTAVAFTNDSKYAVTGCNDGSVKVWEVATGKLISNIQNSGNVVRDIEFTKTQKQLVIANMLRGSTNYGIQIWPTGIVFLSDKSSKDSTALIINKADSLKINTSLPKSKATLPSSNKK